MFMIITIVALIRKPVHMFLICSTICSVALAAANCPTNCSSATVNPVCASNGQVFESKCKMLVVSNCSLTVADWEMCRGLHPLCPADCLDIQDPVCADDGKVYPNKCVMHKRNCGKVIEERPLIFCLGSNRKSRNEEDKCPESCLELYKPVCGSDGHLYLNECYLRLETCRTGVTKVSIKQCVESSSCPVSCIPIYDPVCGSNKQIYINQCSMQRDNCKQPVKSMPLKFCVGDDARRL